MALTKVTTGGIKDGTITNEDISTTTSISQDKLAAKPGASSIASGLMTSADKNKLDGVADNANNYSHPSAHTVSEVTGLQGAIDSKVDDTQVLTDVPVNALFTDTVYTHPASHSVSEVTGLQGLLDGKTTEAYVNTQITNVVGVAPAALDTLTELAAALGDDANFAGTMTTALGNRYTKAEADAKIVELSPPATKAHVDSLAVNAGTLDGIDSTQFARKDVTNAGDFEASGSVTGSELKVGDWEPVTFGISGGQLRGEYGTLYLDPSNSDSSGSIGFNVAGRVTATSFFGSGSNLTGVHHTYDIEYLIVGGGGGGGSTVYDDCGGGGAGGYRSSIAGNPSANYTPPEPPLNAVVGKTYAVSVGAGGGLLGSGNSSGFGLIESVGGGRAGNHRSAGAAGGSGGGGSGQYSASDNVEGGIGYYGQGNNGGQSANYAAAGGGGGAGAPGVGGSGSSHAGGAGVWSLVESNISLGYNVSNRVYRAGGGGSYGGGPGGLGGGGRGWSSSQSPTSGAANTGSGGGGNKENHTYSATVGGGSGIVIIKVPTANYTGITTGSPTVTTIGNYKILKFTSSGSYTA